MCTVFLKQLMDRFMIPLFSLPLKQICISNPSVKDFGQRTNTDTCADSRLRGLTENFIMRRLSSGATILKSSLIPLFILLLYDTVGAMRQKISTCITGMGFLLHLSEQMTGRALRKTCISTNHEFNCQLLIVNVRDDHD